MGWTRKIRDRGILVKRMGIKVTGNKKQYAGDKEKGCVSL